MPFINRFTTTVPGAVTFTGNTLGLSPTSPAPGNIFGTLAVFTTVNTALQVPGFPAGTTDDWRLNSSSAILNLPAGSSVLYAELVWAGTFRTDTEDVLPFLNDNITFTTPAGTFSVTPDPATAQQGSVGNQFYYARSANVTNLVSAGGEAHIQRVLCQLQELQPTQQLVVQRAGRLRLCIKMQVYHFEICQYM